MKSWKKTSLIIILAIIVAGCSSVDLNEFTGSNSVRMEMGELTVLEYNPLTCQMAFNRQRCEFRVQTDDMTDWFTVNLSEIPTEEGQKVTARLSWTTRDDMAEKNNVVFTTMKLEDDTIWLWNSQQNIKLTLKILD